MIRRRKLGSRSARYAHRWPTVVGWSAGAAASAAVPVALAYLHGRSSATSMGEMPDAVFHGLSQAVPTIAITTLAVVALAWCVRRLSWEVLAHRPGRIEVAVFARG